MQRAHRLDVPEDLADVCRAEHLGLVVYDLQVGIMEQIPDGERVLANALQVLDAARAAGVRTVFVRHVTLPVELMGRSQLRMWRAWQRAADAGDVVSPFPPEAPQSRLVPEVAPRPGEAVLDKLTMSAFEGTPLDLVLRDCGLSAVAIVGVALEIGIDVTVRHAADLGYVPVVVTDACGAGDAEAGERALETLRFAGDAELTDTATFVATLSGAAG